MSQKADKNFLFQYFSSTSFSKTFMNYKNNLFYKGSANEKVR